MGRQILIVSVIVLVGAVTPSRADKLILKKDNKTLSGDVTVDKDENGERVYRIVLPDGQTLVFPKDEVKRYQRESCMSDQELLEVFSEFEELALGVLQEPEPSQREFLSRWEHHRESMSRTALMQYSSRTSASFRSRLWETPPDTDKFLDEWVRYAAKFEAVAQNAKYTKHRSVGKRSKSLKEYVSHPPEGREEVAAALRLALSGFEDCIKLARTTTGPLEVLPRRQVEHDSKTRKASDFAQAKYDMIDTAANPRDKPMRQRQDRHRAQRAADDAADTVRYRVTKMQNEMQKLTQAADAKINEFARVRQITLGHFATAWELIEALGTTTRTTTRRSTTTAGSPTSRAPMVAVLDFAADSFGPGVGRTLADLARAVFAESADYVVLDRPRVLTILGQQGYANAARCEMVDCFTSVGKTLHVQKLCHGRAAQVGRSVILTLRIMDVETGRFDVVKTERIEGNVDDLMDNIEQITREVLEESLSGG